MAEMQIYSVNVVRASLFVVRSAFFCREHLAVANRQSEYAPMNRISVEVELQL